MDNLKNWPERQAHAVRSLLLGGWLLLILSLLLSSWASWDPWVGRLASCPPGQACALHDHDGPRLFRGFLFYTPDASDDLTRV